MYNHLQNVNFAYMHVVCLRSIWTMLKYDNRRTDVLNCLIQSELCVT